MGARSSILQSLTRAAVLLVWAIVAWGVLLFASAVANAIAEGPAAAFERLLPISGASIWGWLGPLSVLLALAAAFTAVFLFAAMRPRVSRVRRTPDEG